MKRRRLTRKETAFLQRERVIRIATVGRASTPHVVPVCHAVEDGVIYFGSAAEGQKVADIRRTKRAALVADRYNDRWARLKGVEVVGRAEVFARGPVFERGRRLLYRKYRQYERQAALEPDDSVVVRVRPTHVMGWDYGH